MFNQSRRQNQLQFLLSKLWSSSVLSLSFLALFYHFGVFCHKATSEISTEESSHEEHPSNTLAVEFPPLSCGQSITVLSHFSSTSLAPSALCMCHFCHLCKEMGSSAPVVPHPPNKASLGRPLQFMDPFSELGPWTFSTDLCQ